MAVPAVADAGTGELWELRSRTPMRIRFAAALSLLSALTSTSQPLLWAAANWTAS